MNKILFASASLVLLGTQATAQIRPGDCRPVFPVVDQVAEVIPPPEVAPPPVMVERRRMNGVVFVPLIFVAGLVVVTHHHDHHRNTVSPA